LGERGAAGGGGQAPTERGAAGADGTPATPREPMLVAEARPGWRVAFPLRRVARLEEFALERIEHSGERDVIQYGGDIVPVARLARLLDPHAPDEPWRSRVPAVMLERGEKRLALTVANLIDIVDENLE